MSPSESNSYLVSFCNNRSNDGVRGLLGLVSYGADQQELLYRPIELKIPESLTPKGITGMCWHQGYLVVALQSKTPALLFLNSAFDVVDHWLLDGYKGIHSILSHQGEIYLSVTGLDMIIKSSDGHGFDVVWETGTHRDTIHLNSICIHQDRLHMTAFGHKADESLWSSAKNGRVFDVSATTLVAEGIWHPHSLFSHGEQLYYCHSSLQSIDSTTARVADDLPGYSRGLFVADDYLVCGVSKGRLISHTTGEKISNISDRGTLAGVCGVWLKDRQTDQTCFINLDHVATEVFELMPFNHVEH